LGEEQKDVLRNEILYARTLAGTTSPEVLLIKDNDPTGCAGNEWALDELGVSYQKVGSSQITPSLLADFGVVIIASDQSTAAYNQLAANSGALAAYVEGGGVLLGHAGDYALNGGHWASSFLPGGVAHDDRHPYADELTIVQGSSPIVAGMPGGGVVTDEGLDGWGHSAQSYFTAWPGNAQIVIGVTGNPSGQPTYIQYGYGEGHVLATMQILEWPWCVVGRASTSTAELSDASPTSDTAASYGRATGLFVGGAGDPLAAALAVGAAVPLLAVIPIGWLWRRR
jgi:hypothetical protein